MAWILLPSRLFFGKGGVVVALFTDWELIEKVASWLDAAAHAQHTGQVQVLSRATGLIVDYPVVREAVNELLVRCRERGGAECR